MHPNAQSRQTKRLMQIGGPRVGRFLAAKQAVNDLLLERMRWTSQDLAMARTTANGLRDSLQVANSRIQGMELMAQKRNSEKLSRMNECDARLRSELSQARGLLQRAYQRVGSRFKRITEWN